MSLLDTQLWDRLTGYIIKESVNQDRSDGPMVLVKLEKDLSFMDPLDRDFSDFKDFGTFVHLISINGNTSYVHDSLYKYVKEKILEEKNIATLHADSQEQSRNSKKRKRGGHTIIRDK